jgi:peptidoglycan/xylan/chitin deacetylase (PgdA/CDA1 family)
MPRPVQIALRRRLAAVQQRSAFPRWPAEPALHDLYDLLFGLLAEVAGEPLPRIAAWPDGRSWALVLTHDVETAAGHGNVAPLRERELRHGVRSAWNFVPLRYAVDDALVADLLADGFEVGVHGLHHDGRDIAPQALERRLPQMRSYAARWHATGFRSPALNRDWATMPSLGFAHDSSFPDTDPFGPDGGGCCSWLPMLNDGMVELPVTLAQDHTLFEILRRAEPAEWFAKTEAVRARGGMALLITHPDYMFDASRLDAYERFIARFAPDASAWTALPRDVAAWWRRRAASAVARDGDGWAIAGPAAADGRVELVGADGRATAAPPARARNGAR